MTTKRSRMFDAAFPDGLLSLEGWPFECRGRTWMIHQGRPAYRLSGKKTYFVSDEETGFCCGGNRIRHWNRKGVERMAREFLALIPDDKLAAAIEKSKRLRPTNRITE